MLFLSFQPSRHQGRWVISGACVNFFDQTIDGNCLKSLPFSSVVHLPLKSSLPVASTRGHSASFHWHTSRWQYLVPLANLPSGDLLGIQWDPVNTVSLEKDVVHAISLSPAENCYALNQSWSQGGRLKQIRTFKFSAANEFVFVFTFSMVPITLLCVL